MADRDPLRDLADEDADLYDVATWEPHTRLDRVAARIYGLIVRAAWTIVVLTAFTILVAIGGLSAVVDPQVGVLT
ncbi:PrsW family intramembrane metalloprotease, partial [Halobacteriales archaeon SW_10_68_16]